MRYQSCLQVAPSGTEATVGDSCGIKPDPSLETGWDGEKNLKYWRKKIIRIQETATRLEQEQEEKKIRRRFLQKIKDYKEGKSKGVKL